MKAFDIGCVYRNSKEELFLAVSTKHIITARPHGTLVQLKPTLLKHYEYVRGDMYSVNDLCKIWGVSIEAIEAFCDAHRTLPTPRTRGSRKIKQSSAQDYRELRTVRLLTV